MKYIILSVVSVCLALPMTAQSEEEDSPSISVEQNARALVGTQGASPYTNFCQKRFLKDQRGKLYCNWGQSFSYACSITSSNKYVEKGALIEGPSDAGTCSDGQKVVRIKHY